MLCDFDRIDALLTGELSDEERAAVLAHMENCPACRAYYEAMSGLEGNETVPEGFTQRVMDAVRATPQRKTRRPVWRSMAAVAACAVLVVGLSFGSGLFSADTAAPESANAPGLARDYNGSKECADSAGDDADLEQYAQDLPLTVHTVTDAELCAQMRDWLAAQNIPQLYPDAPREAYDLTLEQVQSLNAAVPEANLPEQMLQLELKRAE